MPPHTPRLFPGIPSRVLPAPADERPAVSSPAGRALRGDWPVPAGARPLLSPCPLEPTGLAESGAAADVEAVLRREPDFAAGFADEMTVRQRREGQPDGMMAAACAVVALFFAALACGVFIAPAVRHLLGAL